jgi:hypothetical protein
MGWANDIPDLLDELRVGRQLERLGPVRLQTKSAPDAVDRRSAETGGCRHRACAPVRRVTGCGFQRFDNHRLNLVVADFARYATPWFIEQSGNTLFTKRPRHLQTV